MPSPYSTSTTPPADASAPPDVAPADNEQAVARHQAALKLWLAWHEREQVLAARLFDARFDQQEIERLKDACDALRAQAVAASQALLNA